MIYKIASKTVAKRLREILSEVISKEQLVFVPGQLINDNIITTYECMHFMKKKRARDGCFCALKLDIGKAYDRLEWDYLQKVMIKLGFHRLWVDMIIRRVNSVSFSLILNGSKLDTFKPSRGIRQGDPISAYLFLLAAKGLQASSNFVLDH